MNRERRNKLLDRMAEKPDGVPLTNSELEAFFESEFGDAFEEPPYSNLLEALEEIGIEDE